MRNGDPWSRCWDRPQEDCGGDVEAAAPDEDLLVAIFLGGLSLVESLEHSVMLLVKPPCLLDGDPVEIHRIEDIVQSLDGSLKVRSVSHFEGETILFQDFTGIKSFLDTFLAQINIGPPCEPVLLVPLALAVTDKYDSLHVLKIKL